MTNQGDLMSALRQPAEIIHETALKMISGNFAVIWVIVGMSTYLFL